MLIKLASVSMQSDKQPDSNTHFFRTFKQRVGCVGKQLIEYRTVVIKRRSELIGYGKGDVLPFAVRQKMLLLHYPLFGGFHTAGEYVLNELFSPFGSSRAVLDEQPVTGIINLE